MTSYERIHQMMAHRPVDFVPRTPILMRFAAEYIGHSYGEFTADHRILTQANIRCIEDFGFDQASLISDPFRETAGFGAEIVIDDRLGPQCHKPLVDDDFDIASLAKPDPLSAPRMRDRIDAVKAIRAHYGDEMSVLGWVEGPAAEAGDLRGPEDFLVDLMEEPETCGELMDLCVEVGVAFAQAQIDAGVDLIGIGDALASQVSPKLYESLILPRQHKLVSAIRDLGRPVRLHICGNITHLLPGIATLPIQALDVDHMVDLAAVRRIVGPNVMIGAHLDPVKDVQKGTPDSIVEQLEAAYRLVGNPFNTGAGCEIPPGTPNENLKALCSPIPYDPNL